MPNEVVDTDLTSSLLAVCRCDLQFAYIKKLMPVRLELYSCCFRYKGYPKQEGPSC
jgi:hypothetical protein